MRGMQGLQDMRASAVEPVRGRENLDVAGRDADGAFAAGQQDFLLGFEPDRSEEHTSELQSHLNLVCRLLLEKKKNKDLLAILDSSQLNLNLFHFPRPPL